MKRNFFSPKFFFSLIFVSEKKISHNGFEIFTKKKNDELSKKKKIVQKERCV